MALGSKSPSTARERDDLVVSVERCCDSGDGNECGELMDGNDGASLMGRESYKILERAGWFVRWDVHADEKESVKCAEEKKRSVVIKTAFEDIMAIKLCSCSVVGLIVVFERAFPFRAVVLFITA